jgi:hypothetical protein
MTTTTDSKHPTTKVQSHSLFSSSVISNTGSQFYQEDVVKRVNNSPDCNTGIIIVGSQLCVLRLVLTFNRDAGTMPRKGNHRLLVPLTSSLQDPYTVAK